MDLLVLPLYHEFATITRQIQDWIYWSYHYIMNSQQLQDRFKNDKTEWNYKLLKRRVHYWTGLTKHYNYNLIKKRVPYWTGLTVILWIRNDYKTDSRMDLLVLPLYHELWTNTSPTISIIQLIQNNVDNEVTTAQIWTVIQKFHHPHHCV